MYAFGLILLLILLSGLVAYLGDQIGMKLGKKRISLLGLRPRYSSIIITILTGMLIATISIMILLTAYSGLRQAIFNINEVLARLNELDTRLAERSQELEELQVQRNQLQEELAETREEFREAENDLAEAREDIAELEEERAQLQEERDELAKERDELEVMVSELRSQRDELDEQLADLNQELSEVNEELEEAQQQVVQFMDEDIVYRKGEIIYSAVIEGGRSESEIITDLNQFLSQANEVATQRQIQVDNETGMALHLQTEDILHAAQVLYNVDPGERLIISLAARVNVPRDETLRADIYINRNYVVFRQNEEISSKVIDADAGTNEIDDQLRELLAEVNREASAKGMLQDIDGTVGSLDFINFYQLVNKIQTYSGEVKVKVLAEEEIWRHDRLSDNLNFEIVETETEAETETEVEVDADEAGSSGETEDE